MTNNTGTVIASPCIGECRLDQQELCVGCLRSMAEIMQWPEADNQQKRRVLARVERRRQQRLAGHVCGGQTEEVIS